MVVAGAPRGSILAPCCGRPLRPVWPCDRAPWQATGRNPGQKARVSQSPSCSPGPSSGAPCQHQAGEGGAASRAPLTRVRGLPIPLDLSDIVQGDAVFTK